MKLVYYFCFKTSDTLKKFALIVAGGKGSRMGSKIPKQFLELNGKPVLMRTIEAFLKFDSSFQIILVLPTDQLRLWKKLCQEYSFNPKIKLANGGLNRVESVRNGLSQIKDDGVVFIHDGVRPLVSQQTIQNCLDGVRKHGCAIPVIPLTDSIRQLTDQKNVAVNRDNYRLVQTPQTFEVKLIKNAFRHAKNADFTDDASIFEAVGHTIKLVEGNSENIKITHASDLTIARLFSEKNS